MTVIAHKERDIKHIVVKDVRRRAFLFLVIVIISECSSQFLSIIICIFHRIGRTFRAFLHKQFLCLFRLITVKQDLRLEIDGINYLCGKTLTEINDCAADGTVAAHVAGGVPVMQLEVPSVDEYVLGQLIYFFEFACGISGYTLGVNPFDQPGVEFYKKNMFHLLGKPGC